MVMVPQDREGGPSRPRAPTITIDTSAATDSNMGHTTQHGDVQDNARINSENVSPTHMRNPSQELRGANSFDSKESRPTSPHNVSSPVAQWSANVGLLNVPGARSRGNSMDSATENGESNSTATYVSTSQGDVLKSDLAPTEILSAKEALKPDPGTVSFTDTYTD